MTDKQRRILDTLIYFLNRYKESILKSKQGTGFEELVFDQMVETIKELQAENIRLNELNKPKILKGENNESD